jgi:hypothetical protein
VDDGAHLKWWVLEGSLTGIDGWFTFALDVQTGIGDLNNRSAMQTFEIESPVECRSVRVRSTGPSHRVQLVDPREHGIVPNFARTASFRLKILTL